MACFAAFDNGDFDRVMIVELLFRLFQRGDWPCIDGQRAGLEIVLECPVEFHALSLSGNVGPLTV